MCLINLLILLSPQVKKKPHKPIGEYVFILENGDVTNSLFLSSAPPREKQRRDMNGCPAAHG